MDTLALRPAAAADLPFLVALFGSTRPELALLGERMRGQMLHLQFEAQRAHYQACYPQTEHSVVMAGTERAGQLQVACSAKEMRLVDISLLPQYRGRGIGGRLLADLQRRGARLGLPLRLHVVPGNPAQQLYLRLGFTAGPAEGMHQAMEWRAAV